MVVAQMHRDDAVLDLAQGPAVLSLHPRRLVAVLGNRCFIDQTDGTQVVNFARSSGHRAMLLRHPLLQLIAKPKVVPVTFGEEQLQGPHSAAGLQRNGLNALSPQVREQSSAVDGEVVQHAAFAEAASEGTKELRQCRGQPGNLFGRHIRPPCRWKVSSEKAASKLEL